VHAVAHIATAATAIKRNFFIMLIFKGVICQYRHRCTYILVRTLIRKVIQSKREFQILIPFSLYLLRLPL
jgi:hypothetical protein